MIEVVSATRFRKKEFWEKSPLGLSLKRLSGDERLKSFITFENRLGLPEIYNARINAKNDRDVLIFVHDDVWLDDYFLADRVIEGLGAYDIIGVAGNRRRVENQPSWAFKDRVGQSFTWDDKANLSGSIACGAVPFGNVNYYGPAPAECELLDGMFLALKKQKILEKRVLFDPLFDFHFYDMDFCRSARAKELHIGTWPICMTHQSQGGAFNTEAWIKKYLAYIDKWAG